MNAVKVKTSELTGAALDWAVAQAVNPPGFVYRMDDEYDPPNAVLGMIEIPPDIYFRVMEIDRDKWLSDFSDKPLSRKWNPSTDWSQGGPLIDDYRVWLVACGGPEGWYANTQSRPCEGDQQFGETSLIAICRAVVVAKLGEEVEVPGELVN